MSTLCSNHATVRLQIIAHKVREKENTMKLNLPNQLTLLRCVLVPIFLAVLILPLLFRETGVQMAQSVADVLTILCAVPIHFHVLKSLPKTDG